MTILPCPWCGNSVGVYQAVRVTGKAKLLWDSECQPCGIDSRGGRRIPHSDAVRCRVCGHIRRDWVAVEGELRKVEEA
jgi:hypothetical protein